MTLPVQADIDLPLVCGKCGRSEGVDRRSEEIHCICGNYAFVGRPARWPFTKPEFKNSEISKSVNPANNISRSRSDENISESESKKQEEKIMAKPTCSREGCREPSEAAYLCADHFKDVYGITVDEYRSNKRHRNDVTQGHDQQVMRDTTLVNVRTLEG